MDPTLLLLLALGEKEPNQRDYLLNIEAARDELHKVHNELYKAWPNN